MARDVFPQPVEFSPFLGFFRPARTNLCAVWLVYFMRYNRKFTDVQLLDGIGRLRLMLEKEFPGRKQRNVKVVKRLIEFTQCVRLSAFSLPRWMPPTHSSFNEEFRDRAQELQRFRDSEWRDPADYAVASPPLPPSSPSKRKRNASGPSSPRKRNANGDGSSPSMRKVNSETPKKHKEV